MGIYTNIGLVKHAEKALALNTKYMWGGLLRPITDAYIATLRNIYGVNSNTGYTTARYKELASYAGKGYYGVDCVGLIKSYYWSGKADGGTGSPNYGAKDYPDVNATYMFSIAKNRGTIDTMPEVPGLIVYSKSHPHVGVYIGDGYTIESTLGSRGDGVVKRKLDNFWEYWFECPYIDYVDKGTTTITDKGQSVKFIYQAISNAAIRAGMSKSSTLYGRVTKYLFYPADMLYSNLGWFKHANQTAYSKLEDGGSLFAKVGEYTIKTVNVNKLNVREKPTLNSDIVTIFGKGDKVYVWNEKPTKADSYTWYKCVVNNKIGYVAGEYLK